MHLKQSYSYAGVVVKSLSRFHPLSIAYGLISKFSTTARRNGTRRPAFNRNDRRRQRKKEMDRQTAVIMDLSDSFKLHDVEQLQMLDSDSAHSHATSGIEQREASKGETKQGEQQERHVNDFTSGVSDTLRSSSSDTTGTDQPGYTRPSDLLPRSLLEIRLSARRNKVPKKRAMLETTNSNPLAHNPYAQALASPIRTCHATGVRLPSYLLTGFGLVKHPETKALWFMPTQLLQNHLRIGDPNTGDEDGRHSTAYIPPIYLSLTQPLIKALAKKSRKHLGRWMMPMQWKVPYGTITKAQEREAVWREDMNDFVLNQLRRKVVMTALRTHLHAKEPTNEIDLKSNVALNLGSGGLEKLQEALNGIQWADQRTKGRNTENDVDLRSCGAVIIITNKGVAPEPVNDLSNAPREGEQHQQSEEGVQQVNQQATVRQTTQYQRPEVGFKTEDRITDADQSPKCEPQGSAGEHIPQPDSIDENTTADSGISPAQVTSQEQQPQDNPTEPPYTFPDLIRAPFANCEIPIFDLSKMLTEAQLNELQTKGHNKRLYSQNGAFFLQSNNESASKLVMTLWSLRCYIGKGEE